MKKNIFRYLAYSFMAVAALTLGSCSDDEKYYMEGNPDNLIYFRAGEANTNVYTATVQHTPVGDYSNLNIKIPVYVQRTVSNSTKVTVALDNALVDEYNTKNGTTYPALPEGALEIQKASVTLGANEYSSSDSIEARLVEAQLPTLTEPEYLTAFRIVDVNGSGKASEERSVIYVKVQTGNGYIHVTNNDEVISSIAHTPIGSLGNVSIDLPAYVSQAAKVGVTATIAVDNSLVAEYNAEHGTSYPAAPNGVLNIENGSVTIAAGETTSSTNFKAAIPADKMPQLTNPQYIIPLRITAKRTDGTTVDNAGVIYMIFTTEVKLVNSGAGSGAMAAPQVSTTVMRTWSVDTNESFNDVTDNRQGSYWDPPTNPSTWVIDMKEVKNFAGLSVRSYYTNYGAVYGLSEAMIELSEDGSNWIECGTATTRDMAYENPYQVITLYGTVPARYIKITLTWNYFNYAALSELRVYAE